MDGEWRIIRDEAMMADTAGGNRARKRDSLFLSAKLKLADEPTVFDVRIRNLSEGGLMAELDRVVEPGSAVSLEMRGLGQLTGTIAWCAHGRLGIALDHSIDPSRARKPVGAGKGQGTVTPLIVPARRR